MGLSSHNGENSHTLANAGSSSSFSEAGCGRPPAPGLDRLSPRQLGLLALILDGLHHPTELASATGITPATVYQHLTALRAKGFLCSSRSGRRTTYTISPRYDAQATRQRLAAIWLRMPSTGAPRPQTGPVRQQLHTPRHASPRDDPLHRGRPRDRSSRKDSERILRQVNLCVSHQMHHSVAFWPRKPLSSCRLKWR
jgi:DNA-binding transcriptional ArsR family regulator